MLFFFFNDTATTEIYTLSLHDALPISDAFQGATRSGRGPHGRRRAAGASARRTRDGGGALRGGLRRLRGSARRSEEHTSELQSRQYLVCRLLLEKKKNDYYFKNTHST